MTHPPASKPAIVLAFLVLYCSWGTTYLATRIGVADLPPCLFAGTRLGLAGFLLLTWLRLRGISLRLTRPQLVTVGLAGLLFFATGNGLLTYAQTTINSSMAAVLVSQTPLWFALMESLMPRGERLTGRGWFALAVGLGGVLLLKWDWNDGFVFDIGLILATASSISWSFGSLLVRHRRERVQPFVAAGYQMLIGGTALALAGVSFGELTRVTSETLTQSALLAFVYLLIVSSLGGFVAFNFLLAHVSPALASTYAYVNPCVAIWVGWLILDEPITLWMLGCMAVILGSVALLRLGGVRPARIEEPAETSVPLLPPRVATRPVALDESSL